MLLTPKHSIQDALSEVKSQLIRAAADHRHKMRFFQISTLSRQPDAVSSRMVVLRKFFPDWRIRFYTDSRTQKVAELRENPKLSTLFWDPSKNIQIRMNASAVIHHQNSISNEEWKTVHGEAQKSYTGTLIPATPISSPEIAHSWPEEPHDNFFTVIDCDPVSIRVLQLHKNEHISLKYDRESASDEWTGNWIAP